LRRRLLVATISALAVAVVLLGIPLAVFAAQLVRDDAVRDLTARAQTTARALDVRYSSGEEISDATLQSYLGGTAGGPDYIVVRLPDGMEYSAGEQPNRSFSGSHYTDDGVIVLTYASWWDVFWRAAWAVGIVIGVGVVAVAAGVGMAMWQANRLSAPLIYLAASAEQLGAGQVKLQVKKSGVEEIDQVADELVRSADRMAARLAAERQFAADASHQLRTPLTALSMRLEEISAMSSQEDVRAEAEASLEQIERLTGVIDDLLGRSRRTLGGATEVVALQEVLDQQEDEWEPAFDRAKRLLRVTPTQVRVFATPGGLAQVLATLIENSLTHGGGTTTVTARASGASRRSTAARIAGR